MSSKIRAGIQRKPGTFGVLIEWDKYDDEKSIYLRLPWVLLWVEWGEEWNPPQAKLGPDDTVWLMAHDITENFGMGAWQLVISALESEVKSQVVDNGIQHLSLIGDAYQEILDKMKLHLPFPIPEDEEES